MSTGMTIGSHFARRSAKMVGIPGDLARRRPRTLLPSSGDPLMRTPRWWAAGALLAASVLAPVSRGDEPTRPTATATEANPAVPAAGHSLHGEAFNDGPRHRGALIPGMGKSHFPVTTAKPEAQAFIDQGVAQLHSF